MIEQNLVDYFEKSLKQNWKLNAFTNYNKDTTSYAQVADRITFLHKLFSTFGLKADNKIAILGKNCSNWAITYLSTLSYGATIVPILPDFKSSDVHHIINHSDSLLLFCEESIYDDLDLATMKNLKAVISLSDFSILDSSDSVSKLFDEVCLSYLDKFDGTLKPENLNFDEVKNNKLAAIVYTSGTTGFSKGVMIPHNALISNIVFAQANLPLQPQDTIVSFLPIAHVFGCVFEFLFPFCSGCHITFLSKTPSPRILIQAFDDVKPRLILSVPLIIEKIYRKQIKPAIEKPATKILRKIPGISTIINNKVKDKLSAVFGGNFLEIVIGGASLNEEVENFLREIKFHYTVGYGMTECAPLISFANWNRFAQGSVGISVDKMEVKIDSNDPQNVVGEIMVKGENVMYGYYRNKEATDAVLSSDGWFRTGDLGVIDAEGNIFIRGRSKSMILGPSGKNIYPEEIEAKLNNLDYISESIVIDKNHQLIALVYPDFEAADKMNIEENTMKKIMEENRLKLNKNLPGYMKITKIEISATEFEKTPKKSIKRYLYTG